MFEQHSSWNDNPFLGSRELHGLKILVMLLSNWDTKDRRDAARGSNTAIFERRVGGWRHEARYLITDWGGSIKARIAQLAAAAGPGAGTAASLAARSVPTHP